MFNIGPQELLVILLVALVIVGPKRLPELSRTVGRALRELRKAQDEVSKTINLSLDEPPEPVARPSPVTPSGAETDVEASPSDAPSEADEDEGAAVGSAEADERDVDAAKVARTLGRGLAELRRAREEIQRSFHLDLTDEPGAASADGVGTTSTPVPDEPASDG